MPPAAGPSPRSFASLPGPRQYPVVGNALQIRPSAMHHQLEGWARRYGAFYRLHLGRRNLLVISDHALIGAALRDRPESFRRPLYSGIIVRELGFDQGVFFANDELWRRQRRMVMAGFDPGHVRAYFPALLKVTQRLQRRWLGAAQHGTSIDLQADLMRFTVDAIAGLAFGSEVNTLESDDDVIQRHLNKIFPAVFRRIARPGPVVALLQAALGPRARSQCRRGQDRRSPASSPRRGSACGPTRSCAPVRATCWRP